MHRDTLVVDDLGLALDQGKQVFQAGVGHVVAALGTNVFVDAYMNVHCCWDGCFKPIGNLQEHSLKEIWSSKAYQDAREKMMDCDCSGCWYLCTGEVTMFLLDKEM